MRNVAAEGRFSRRAIRAWMAGSVVALILGASAASADEDVPAHADAPSQLESQLEPQLEPKQRPAPPAPESLLDPDWVSAPIGYTPGQLDSLRRAVTLEARGHGREAEAIYSELASHAGAAATAHWRASRALFTAAEHLPSEEREARIALLERSQSWAERGLERDRGCAECMLYKAAALGRLSTIHGVVWGARRVREIRDLLDAGIALDPRDRDGPHNSTLANLFFARATLYRTVPEWFWLSWVVGMRGDIDRALADIRLARRIHPERLDYHVEHGVILVCLGKRRGRPESTREGIRVLREAAARPPRIATDTKDLRMVQELLQNPARACEFSRDGFMDIEEHEHADEI